MLFPLPDGRVITRIEQLKNSDARIALRNYIDLKKSIENDRQRLEQLRLQYAKGNKEVSSEILELERRVQEMTTLLNVLQTKL